MEHVLHKCDEHGCYVCNGGLGLCTVCGGAEGEMPTDCPGRTLSEIERASIMRGDSDFRNGQWVGLLHLDLTQMPAGADWRVECTNGGLTISAQVGPKNKAFGDTVQEAVDRAIDLYNNSLDLD